MHLHLGGHLSWYAPDKRSDLEVSLSQPSRLMTLVQGMGVPPAEVAITVVNGNAVSLEDVTVSDGDRVQLYPPVGGGNS